MKILIKILLVTILICLITFRSFGQTDKAKVIAAYINNFARFITWPNENQLDSFRIGIFTNNIDLIKEFDDYSKKRRIKEKPISLTIFKTYPSHFNFQILMLSEDNSNYITQIYDAIEGKSTLLISENYKDQRNIMINFIKTSQEQLSFEVNKANVINQKLSIDPEILLSGGTEIDVASLYRKSQFNLRNMQKNMDIMSDSLKNLQEYINTSIDLINKQQSAITRQKNLLEEQIAKINKDQEIIQSQRGILGSQQDSINIKNRVLLKMLNDVKKHQSELEYQEQILRTNQKQIEVLNKEIKNKNITLGSQSETIVRQKQMLLFSIIIGFLIILLVTAIYIGYRKNKHKSQILASQKREIGRKLNEVEKLNLQLKNADQYKSIFLASMSHELRTPLNSIIGYTGILLMGMTGKLSDEQNKQLSKIKNNAKHLLSLINDILDISKIEADRVELHIEEFKLKDMINQVVEIINPKVIEKQLELTIDLKDDLTISTDERRIKQVVLNLVSNAVNYSETGIIHISSKRLSDNKFRISVKDTGIGISEDDMLRLFQPFQQIDSSLTKKTSGTGLGLYLCRKILKMLGGDIFVKSELGKGSEFYIEMPIKYKKD
ncbi:MAG: DUF4154 domain-containing protein [Ignavibacteriae bacterium]|nr:DUF4154 domain-containing protein [Ignavibacteriota bacterium]